MTTITIALAGNPNSGKTTLFNAFTGAKHHVGNWPGKTVERRSGTISHRGVRLDIVDLPGAYSLSATSPEESIARDALVEDRPDLVVVVVDAAHLERNLYLTVQILEIGLDAVVALSMTDVAREEGIEIDLELLAARLGVPVVPIAARSGTGVAALLDAIVEHTARSAA